MFSHRTSGHTCAASTTSAFASPGDGRPSLALIPLHPGGPVNPPTAEASHGFNNTRRARIGVPCQGPRAGQTAMQQQFSLATSCRRGGPGSQGGRETCREADQNRDQQHAGAYPASGCSKEHNNVSTGSCKGHQTYLCSGLPIGQTEQAAYHMPRSVSRRNPTARVSIPRIGMFQRAQ